MLLEEAIPTLKKSKIHCKITTHSIIYRTKSCILFLYLAMFPSTPSSKFQRKKKKHPISRPNLQSEKQKNKKPNMIGKMDNTETWLGVILVYKKGMVKKYDKGLPM